MPYNLKPMTKDKLQQDLSALVPDRTEDANDRIAGTRAAGIQNKVEAEAHKQTARELAAIKRKEQKALEQERRRVEELKAKGIIDAASEALCAKREEKIEAIETLEAETLSNETVVERAQSQGARLRGLVDLQSTTPAEVQRLLAGLDINLNLHLTKNDTANLLSCLLTCNEQQLLGLMDNSSVPIAIKTVIKRLLDDASKGNMSTVEKLWDRVFGKAAMVEPVTTPDSAMPGLIPGRPVSREAYILLRDTIIN